MSWEIKKIIDANTKGTPKPLIKKNKSAKSEKLKHSQQKGRETETKSQTFFYLHVLLFARIVTYNSFEKL